MVQSLRINFLILFFYIYELVEMVEKKKKMDFVFGVSDMPLSKFKEWSQDAKDNFSDIYWVKLWNDHTSNRNNQLLNDLSNKLAMLEQHLVNVESQLYDITNKKKENVTFGDARNE